MVLGQENVVDIFVCDGYKSSATAGQTAAEGLNACTNATSRGNHWLLVSGGFQVEYNTPGGEILKSVSFRSGEPSDWQVRADISQATKPCDGRDCFTYVGHRDHGEIDVIDATTNEIVDTMKISGRHVSMDAPFVQGEENSLLDVLENDSEETPDSDLMVDSLRKEVQRALSTLTQREADVVTYYFGLNGAHVMTLEEIGEKFNLTRERVRQIKEKAIRRLRHTSRSKALKPYLG
jgi:RNA polymerase sigma factor (sigma-70 family)